MITLTVKNTFTLIVLYFQFLPLAFRTCFRFALWLHLCTGVKAFCNVKHVDTIIILNNYILGLGWWYWATVSLKEILLTQAHVWLRSRFSSFCKRTDSCHSRTLLSDYYVYMSKNWFVKHERIDTHTTVKRV